MRVALDAVDPIPGGAALSLTLTFERRRRRQAGVRRQRHLPRLRIGPPHAHDHRIDGDRRHVRAAREAAPRAGAQAGLDVLLTDAAVGARHAPLHPAARRRRRSAPASRATRAASRAAPAALGTELARVAAGRSEQAPAKGDRRFADPAWERNWLLRRVHAGLPGGRRDRRRRDHRRAARLADRAPGALRGDQRPRRARADELPVVQPGRAARDRRRGRRQPRARRPALRRRRRRGRRGCRRASTPRASRSAATSPPRPARSCCAPRSSS